MTKPKATQVQKDAALANALRLLGKKSLPKVSTAGGWQDTDKPLCNSTTTGNYDGRELRPFAGRPGSLDFLAYPSRTAGGLVHRGGVI